MSMPQEQIAPLQRVQNNATSFMKIKTQAYHTLAQRTALASSTNSVRLFFTNLFLLFNVLSIFSLYDCV